MTCDDLDAVHALLLAMTAFGVLGGIACFAASIVACVGLCCYKSEVSSKPKIWKLEIEAGTQ